MSTPRIISETQITMAEVRDEIAKIKSRSKDAELGFRVQKTEEYLNSFTKLSTKDTLALKKDIEDLGIPRLASVCVVKLCDLLPETVDEVKVMLQGYSVTITKENMQKIVECVKKYV